MQKSDLHVSNRAKLFFTNTRNAKTHKICISQQGSTSAPGCSWSIRGCVRAAVGQNFRRRAAIPLQCPSSSYLLRGKNISWINLINMIQNRLHHVFLFCRKSENVSGELLAVEILWASEREWFQLYVSSRSWLQGVQVGLALHLKLNQGIIKIDSAPAVLQLCTAAAPADFVMN